MRRKLHVGDGPVAGESALVGGRRPGCGEAAVFDETAVEAEPGGCRRGIGRKIGPSGRSRQRASEATLHARRAVEEAAVGNHCAKGPSIEVPPDRRSGRIGRTPGASAPEIDPEGLQGR